MFGKLFKLRARGVGAAMLGLLLASVLFVAPQEAANASTVTFTLGAARSDTTGNALQLHGLGIIKVGGTWYGFGEDKAGETSTDTSFQDIPCYSSTDLSTWTRVGVALAKQGSGDLGPNRIVERPKVIYNAATAQYVMYVHIDDPSYAEAKVGVATSSTPCGTYTYQGSFRPLGFQSRDIGLFQDTDGSAYLLSEDRVNGLRIDRLSSDYLSVASAVAVLPDYEAPAMVKVGATYYLLGSHLTGWSVNDNVYSTTTSLAGPWSPFKTLAAAGTNTYGSQTANIITVQGASGTSYLYAGDRWNTADLGASALIWLPLTIRGTTMNLGQYPTWSLDAAAGQWAATSGLPSDGTHTATNASSGLLMDVSGSALQPGAPVIQWPGTGGANQKWLMTRVADNLYTIVNSNSGLCLDVPNQSLQDGVQLAQWTCNGGDNQLWAADLVGSYSGQNFVFVSAKSDLSIGVGSSSQGAQVLQQTPTGASNQQWVVG